MESSPASSFRKDIASAYAVTFARVTSWVVVSAIVFRRLGADALGVLTLIRATVGILSYTSLGLGPAMVKMLADADRPGSSVIPVAALAVDDDVEARPLLAYAQNAPQPAPASDIARVYLTGEILAFRLGVLGLLLGGLYCFFFNTLHRPTADYRSPAQVLVLLFAAGTIFRLMSDAPSALLQARRRIALDNTILALSELAWGLSTAALLWPASRPVDLTIAGITFAAISVALLLARGILGRLEVRSLVRGDQKADSYIAKKLLALGLLLVLAQAADFLYAPTDCILINQLIGSDAVAYYSPAIQIDAGLLLLVSGLAAVLYPRSSIAHAAGDITTIRRYYIRGTAISAALLVAAAAFVWALAKPIFLLWFKNPMDPTRAILPLLLIHTIVGGSSAVGRSVLLAVGKAKPFTVAVITAGIANVILSYAFVRWAHLGLRGIVLGTIVAVVARCAIWMPWYITRTLKRLNEQRPA